MPIESDKCSAEEWDAARRMRDAVNLHVLALENEERPAPPYVAIRLSDGRSPDGIAYPSRREAARAQRADPWCFYVKIGRQTMTEKEALILLMYARMAKKRGVVFSEEETVLPQRLELARPFIPRTLRAALDTPGLPATFQGGNFRG